MGQSSEKAKDNELVNTENEVDPKEENSLETESKNDELNGNIQNGHQEVDEESAEEKTEASTDESSLKSISDKKSEQPDKSNVNEIEESIENNLAVEVQ